MARIYGNKNRFKIFMGEYIYSGLWHRLKRNSSSEISNLYLVMSNL